MFQGTEGAYGEAAMHQFFGEDVNCFHVRTFRDAMTAIEEGAADMRFFRLKIHLQVR